MQLAGINVELELLRGSCVGASSRDLQNFADVCSFHEKRARARSVGITSVPRVAESKGLQRAANASASVIRSFLAACKRDGRRPSPSRQCERQFERAVARSALVLIGTIVSHIDANKRAARLACAMAASKLVGLNDKLIVAWLQVEAIGALGRGLNGRAHENDDVERISIMRAVVQRALHRGKAREGVDADIVLDGSLDPVRFAARLLIDESPLQPSGVSLLKRMVEDVRVSKSHQGAIDALAMLSAMCKARDDVGRWIAEESSWPRAIDRFIRTLPASPLDDEVLCEVIYFLSSVYRRMRPGDGSRQYLVLVLCRDRLVRLLDRSIDSPTFDHPLVPRRDLRAAILGLIVQLLSADTCSSSVNCPQSAAVDVCIPCYLESAYTLARETNILSVLCAHYIDPDHRYSINQTGQRVDEFLLSAAVEAAGRICCGHAALAARTASAAATRRQMDSDDAIMTPPFYEYCVLDQDQKSTVERALGVYTNSQRWALPPRTSEQLALLESNAHAKHALTLLRCDE